MSTPDAAAPQPQQDPAPLADSTPEAAGAPGSAPSQATEGAGTAAPLNGAWAPDTASADAPRAAAAGETIAEAEAEAEAEAAEPVVVVAEREVTLQRSVRYGRLLIGGLVLGAAVALLISVVFPVAEGADYTLGQAAGFTALIGAAVGLGLGGLLGLVLGFFARRSSGRGVAIQSDVR